MDDKPIRLDIKDNMAVLTLHRPERLNSFSAQMHEDLAKTLDSIAADTALRAVILTGSGRAFCAGQDLSERAVSPGDAIDLGAAIETYYAPLIRRLASLSIPVLCAVNGVAAGAGVSLALACDIVIAARSASFILSFAHVGLIPDSGGSYHLPRMIGQARALGLALTGDTLSAEHAEAWGLIWKTVDDDQLMTETETLARRLANGPTRGFAETRATIRASWDHTLDAQLDHERDTMRRLGTTHDYREAVTAFLAKRSPVFTGR